jgi:biotin carboxylase
MLRVLLVLPTATYRAPDFLDAARSVGADVVVASEEAQAMGGTMGDRAVTIDLCDPAASAERIVALHERSPVDAVIGVDEQGVLVAAEAAARLGFPHNPPAAVEITRDKALQRKVLTDAGLPQPRFEVLDGFAIFVPRTSYVIKAASLSGSRGVIRADTPDDAAAAVERVRAIAGDGATVLAETYVPGAEVAVEGLLRSGRLEVLAIFDKPDPLEGPFFEETIYVTPSRLDAAVQVEVADTVQRACDAIGLVEGPVHAEVRLPDDEPVLLEVAARSIGGLCSRALRFGAGISLEELILRHALGMDPGEVTRRARASGVMMIPIPRSGELRAVGGTAEARAVAGVDGVEITVPVGQTVRALPEGDRYLGFVFASGEAPSEVESSLRAAHAALRIEIS